MSPRTDEAHIECPKPKKKARIEATAIVDDSFELCRKLLHNHERCNPSPPRTITEFARIGNGIHKFRNLLDRHGFRTSIIMSPREGLSLYKDSCQMKERDLACELLPGRLFLVAMFGLHSQQRNLERIYAARFKKLYCLLLFCTRIRVACPNATKDTVVQELLSSNENLFTESSSGTFENAVSLSSSVPRRVQNLIELVNSVESRNRVEQLEHEYERIVVQNSTVSNALVTMFLLEHSCCIKDIFFKRSHQPKYERVTIYLYDSELDYYKPPHFLFIPSINQAVEGGPEKLVEEMLQSFWSKMLRQGYFATPTLKSILKDDLQRFFLSGMTSDVRIPLKLNAHFTPSTALSLFLYGKAGSGKSSFVRNFQPSLEATIEEHLDPAVLVRLVKQNLNKRYETLELELDLRPNNNDLSVMSIIQGRRMTMGQSKPGLVVVNLEEMPSNEVEADPNQLKVAQLISQRFSGRKGDFHMQGKAPRNSERGIQNDSSLVTLFTSNYELDTPCEDALRRLQLFEHLSTHEITAVTGEDRAHFAKSYTQQCIKNRLPHQSIETIIDLDVPLGEGDTRNMVRRLRMIAFYICEMVTGSMKSHGMIEAKVSQKQSHCQIRVGTESLDLKVGTFENLFPLTPQSFNPSVSSAVIDSLTNELDETCDVSELSTVLSFWLSKTLAPAVIVSNHPGKIQKLVEAIEALENIHSLKNVNASEYKMMKSLYDPNDTPNLRDDILKLGRGAHVVVELKCPSRDSQLCIREMIEDSPSMTAFSTSKSALHKSGLLFCVYVDGEITPEVQSRASLII